MSTYNLCLLTLHLLLGTLVSASDEVTLADKVADMDLHIRSLESQVRDLKKQLSDVSQSSTNTMPFRAVRASSVNVAFSSYLDHSENNVQIDTIIPFNKLILNDGGAYSNVTVTQKVWIIGSSIVRDAAQRATIRPDGLNLGLMGIGGSILWEFKGIFNAPITGVYMFTYTVNTVVDARQLVVKLVVDGVNISDGTSDPFHNGQEIQGGNTVLYRVNQGQSVWLAAYNTGNTIVDGRETHRFSTFSGVLLYT